MSTTLSRNLVNRPLGVANCGDLDHLIVFLHCQPRCATPDGDAPSFIILRRARPRVAAFACVFSSRHGKQKYCRRPAPHPAPPGTQRPRSEREHPLDPEESASTRPLSSGQVAYAITPHCEQAG